MLRLNISSQNFEERLFTVGFSCFPFQLQFFCRFKTFTIWFVTVKWYMQDFYFQILKDQIHAFKHSIIFWLLYLRLLCSQKFRHQTFLRQLFACEHPGVRDFVNIISSLGFLMHELLPSNIQQWILSVKILLSTSYCRSFFWSDLGWSVFEQLNFYCGTFYRHIFLRRTMHFWILFFR